MDAAGIQAKVYAGYAKAAQYVGLSFKQYRGGNGADVLGPIGMAPKATLTASFTPAASTFNFGKGPTHKDTFFNTLIDGSQTQVGDYLVGAADTYFICSQQPLLPIVSVRCNRVLTISAPGPSKTYGAQSAYSGTTPANETPVMAGWPASLLFDARGRAAEVGLPLDLPSPFYVILMPAWPETDVRTGYVITDDQDRRYIVSATELTPLGWRIFAQQAIT